RSPTRPWCSKPSIHCSTSATTRPPSGTGRPTTFSTVAHIGAGRSGLFELIKSIPRTLRYEAGVILAEGDFVVVHGRFSGFGAPANWIAADILRIENGVPVEHWDVIKEEATQEQSKSGRPMF